MKKRFPTEQAAGGRAATQAVRHGLRVREPRDRYALAERGRALEYVGPKPSSFDPPDDLLVDLSEFRTRPEQVDRQTANLGLLHAVRDTLRAADDAYVSVAFAHERGVRLLGEELEALRRRHRHTFAISFK